MKRYTSHSQIMSQFAPLRQVPPGSASKGCHSSPGLKAWGFLACLIKISFIKEGPPMLKEFKEFAMRGNVIDMAVGIIIGAAFGTIVNSLVQDVIMPPIGLLLGNVDFSNIFLVLREGAKAPGPYASVAAAKAAGATTLNY